MPDYGSVFRSWLEEHESLKRRKHQLEVDLAEARSARAPESLRGYLAHLITMARDPETTGMDQRMAAWDALMVEFPRLISANDLGNRMTQDVIKSDLDLQAARKEWAEGVQSWRKSKPGLESRLAGPEEQKGIIARWLQAANAQSYASPYSYNTVLLLMGALRARRSFHRYLSSSSEAQNHASKAYSKILNPLDTQDMPSSQPGHQNSSPERWAAWLADLKAALHTGSLRIVGCIAVPTSERPSSGQAAPSWAAFDLDALRQDVRIYRCSEYQHEPRLQEVGLRKSRRSFMLTQSQVFRALLLASELDDLHQIHLEDPVRDHCCGHSLG